MVERQEIMDCQVVKRYSKWLMNCDVNPKFFTEGRQSFFCKQGCSKSQYRMYHLITMMEGVYHELPGF
jgi:ribosomal protein L36